MLMIKVVLFMDSSRDILTMPTSADFSKKGAEIVGHTMTDVMLAEEWRGMGKGGWIIEIKFKITERHLKALCAAKNVFEKRLKDAPKGYDEFGIERIEKALRFAVVIFIL